MINLIIQRRVPMNVYGYLVCHVCPLPLLLAFSKIDQQSTTHIRIYISFYKLKFEMNGGRRPNRGKDTANQHKQGHWKTPTLKEGEPLFGCVLFDSVVRPPFIYIYIFLRMCFMYSVQSTITGPGGRPRTVGHDLKFESTGGKMMLAPHSARRVETRRAE